MTNPKHPTQAIDSYPGDGYRSGTMALIMLRDGSHIELPQCRDVVHKLTFLMFVDAVDAPLLCLPAEDVYGYTMNSDVAARILGGEEDYSIRGRKKARAGGDN